MARNDRNVDENDLYYCAHGGANPVWIKKCPHGCQDAGAGRSDYCLGEN